MVLHAGHWRTTHFGTWGTGLYSQDFALGLRIAVAAVARQPFEPVPLIELLCEEEPAAANDPINSHHSMFWLVIADLFAKRGIDCPSAREKGACHHIHTRRPDGHAGLGLNEKSLAKRGLMLAELQMCLGYAPEPAKPRNVLKAPRKLVLEVGDVIGYPTQKGWPINPYGVGRRKHQDIVKDWSPDGWGAFMVADCGPVSGFLASYWPLRICDVLKDGSTFETLVEPLPLRIVNAGTLNARFFTYLRLKSLGRVPIDTNKVISIFRPCKTAIGFAVSDILVS